LEYGTFCPFGPRVDEDESFIRLAIGHPNYRGAQPATECIGVCAIPGVRMRLPSRGVIEIHHQAGVPVRIDSASKPCDGLAGHDRITRDASVEPSVDFEPIEGLGLPFHVVRSKLEYSVQTVVARIDI